MKEIDPKVFGPGTWCVLHVLAIVSEEDRDKDNYINLVYRILHSLPCGVCRRHAVKYLDENPVEQNHEFEWSVDFHNSVNKRLKKPMMSIEEARGLYENTELLLKSKHVSCSLKVSSCEDQDL